MPKKIRELKSMLLKAGFTSESAKGSHSKRSHRQLLTKVIISGKDGNDAKTYLEKQVIEALQKLKNLGN